MSQGGLPLQMEELSPIMERVVCDITQRVGRLELSPAQQASSEGHGPRCALQTTLDGAYRSRLVLAGDYAFFSHLAENMMGGPPAPEDVEDYALEYFNMLCGHVVAEIFRETQAAAKFHCPIFCREGGTEPASPAENSACFHSPFGALELRYEPILPVMAGNHK